jgi:hypothetical protein
MLSFLGNFSYQLKMKSGAVEKILEGYNDLDDGETKDFCFPGTNSQG